MLQGFPQSSIGDDNIAFNETTLSFNPNNKFPCPITLEDKDNIVSQHKHSPRAPNSSPQRSGNNSNIVIKRNSRIKTGDLMSKIGEGISQNDHFPMTVRDLFIEIKNLDSTVVPSNTPLDDSDTAALPLQLEINSATSANQRWLRVSSFNSLESVFGLSENEKDEIFSQYMHSSSTPCNSQCNSPM